MKKYEALFLIEPTIAQRDWTKVNEHVQSILAKHQAAEIHLQKWGERKLTFSIRGHKRATYLLAHFQAPGETPGKIKRDAVVSEIILRVLVVSEQNITGTTEGAEADRKSAAAV